MATSPKSESRAAVTGKGEAETRGIAGSAKALTDKARAKRKEAVVTAKIPKRLLEALLNFKVEPLVSTNSESAENAMLQDIDVILSRLDDGIAKERKAMDDLLERIRQPAA